MNWVNWTDWTTRSMWSWENLCHEAARTTRMSPMVSADPIPEVPLGATFGRINQWFDEMDEPTRQRLIVAARQYTLDPNDQINTDDETDDENFDDNA
jgi:hypothetical protein